MNKIDDLISKMSLEEKAALCTGATAWSTTPVERLGIPALMVSDGPHGVRHEVSMHTLGGESLPATCFPTASCSACTWDVELMDAMGQAIAEECIALGVDVILGPGVNMKRSPVCGRNFEYFSEDPYLAGQLASSYIAGVQSRGVGTSLKHFAANSQETRRLTVSSEVDERTLREIYLPAFETAVKKAKPWTVMCAYNKLNGTYCSENQYLLVDILKNEWGFEGLVVSDWTAVHDRVASLQSGLDLEMPGPRGMRVKAVVEAVRAGKLEESTLDDSVRRILGIVFMAAKTPKGIPYDQDAHHALARKIAGEGIVLLKNNGILPLKDQKHIAIIGRAAKEPYMEGGGSSHVNPTRIDIPTAELKKLAGGAEGHYAEGYGAGESYDQGLIDEAVDIAKAADVALLYIALPESKESEGYDRSDLDLTNHQVDLIKAVCNVQPQTVVILNNGAPVVMGEWIDRPAAILEAWMMGQAGGGAIADVLYGVVNPCGKLAETIPFKLTDTPAYLNFPGENDRVRYGEGLYIGYRYYDARDMAVQFPFGYGLSYTTFDYTNLQVSSPTVIDTEEITVSVDVTNTGKLKGKEIAQLYVHDRKSRLPRPPKELKGFAKVELNPGETKTITLSLDFRSFAYYDPAFGRWVTEDGEFDILVGSSSADIRCTQTITLKSTIKLPCRLTIQSTVGDWIKDPIGRLVLAECLRSLPARIQHDFGGITKDAFGEEISGFTLAATLPNKFHDFENELTTTPEEIVNELLARVYASDKLPA